MSGNPSAFVIEFLAGLIMSRSCTGNHSCCELMWETTTSNPVDSTRHSYIPAPDYFLLRRSLRLGWIEVVLVYYCL